MGKRVEAKQKRKEAKKSPTEARAVINMLRTSPRKLNLVAESIRGQSVNAALVQLSFLNKRISRDVKKCLQSAIANAENNQQLNVDELVVKEAFVGKALVMKRFSARARGRSSRILKPFSKLTIIVREQGKVE